jgi:hypothetical protein
MLKALVLVAVSACVPVVAAKSEGIRSTIDITPKTPPSVVGGYEFELLDALNGEACVALGDMDVKTASIPGFEPTQSTDILDQRAEGAAVYDAMSKAQGADTLLITWVKIVREGDRKCATVHARGVRLRQAGTAVPTPANAPIPAPAAAPGNVPPASAPTPAP